MIIITNTIKRINTETIKVPVIIRADAEGWVPDFDIWETAIEGDTSYIDCTQNFGKELKHYHTTEIDSQIGYYNGENLIIYWKALINTADVKIINETYSGKLRACNWQKRYCTYFGNGKKKSPWLHSIFLSHDEFDYVVHHINAVAADNRRHNLHLLPKREHDGISHLGLEERKRMFANPKEYWQSRKSMATNEFINQLALIITNDGKNDFIANFAKKNIKLTKEILEASRTYVNLSSISEEYPKSRNLNQHLSSDYLDTYEMEKYLKTIPPKVKKQEGQLRMF